MPENKLRSGYAEAATHDVAGGRIDAIVKACANLMCQSLPLSKPLAMRTLDPRPGLTARYDQPTTARGLLLNIPRAKSFAC